MKKMLSMMLVVASLVCFHSCSDDDDDNGFDYPMETLIGTWEGTDICIDGKWYDITSYWYSDFQFSITFYDNGKYYGRGYFGTGSGTYTAKGKTIKTYVDGKPYYVYEVISLNNNTAHLYMGVDGSDEKIQIKVEKK